MPSEKDLAALAVDLLGKCQPGDGIDIETTCGNTILKVFVKREHAPQCPLPQAPAQPSE